MKVNPKRKSSYNPLASPLNHALQLAVSRAAALNTSQVNNSFVQNLASSRSRVQTQRTPNKRVSQSRVRQRSRYHPQVSAFLKKYFNVHESDSININEFIQALCQQHSDLWRGQHAVLQELIPLIHLNLANQDGTLDCHRFRAKTAETGILGMLTQFLSELQNQQGGEDVKGVIGGFVQEMYKKLQDQLYAKFNTQLRRMVIKAKEAQRLLKQVNDKITNNYHLFQSNTTQTTRQLKSQKAKTSALKNQNERLFKENKRMSEKIEQLYAQMQERQRQTCYNKQNKGVQGQVRTCR